MTRYREIGSAEMTSAHGVESPAGSDAAFICLSGLHDTLTAASLHPECKRANYAMTSIVRAAAIAAREGVNYAQSKAVFKAARQCAGLRASAERRGGIDRLTVEEELRFLDQAYGQDGRTGLMLQTLTLVANSAASLPSLPRRLSARLKVPARADLPSRRPMNK
jgi:hypothetical protein